MKGIVVLSSGEDRMGREWSGEEFKGFINK